MAYTTPALTAIAEGQVPIQEALTYAHDVLRAEGENVDVILIGSEAHRHYFAVALDFQRDVYTLRTLAGLAFSDDHLGPGLLDSTKNCEEALVIARDFNSKYQQMHPILSYVCEYVRDIRSFGNQQPITKRTS